MGAANLIANGYLPYLFRNVRKRNQFEDKDIPTEDWKDYGPATKGWGVFGSIHTGRSIEQIGAHTTGYNSHSIGICYIRGYAADGKTPKDTRTEAQRRALIKLLRELKAKYPSATIHVHNEFANKACPSFIVKNDPVLCAI